MSRWSTWLLVVLVGGCASGHFLKPLSECQEETAAPNPQTAGGRDAEKGTGSVSDESATAADASAPSPFAAVEQVQVEHGKPNQFLDGAGQVFGVRRKLLLWNRRVDNHHISAKTELMTVQYLRDHDLPEVLVRVNQYDPLGEWKRLTSNRRIGAGWRYTVGAFDWLLYTLMPGRLFGQDWYNPFSDTINLYSDVPAIALHEAAYAMDVHRRRYPGTYVTVQHIPVIGMWYRTNATIDILNYLKQHGETAAELQEADNVLFPMYGGAAGGQIGAFIPIPFMGDALMLAGTVSGHVVGRFRAHQEKPQGQEEEAEPRQE